MSYEELKRRLLQNAEVRERYENSPLALALARAVVERRLELGLTQAELAERLGTSQNQVWRIESGHANPRLDTLDRLREALHLCVEVRPPNRREGSDAAEAVVDGVELVPV